MQWKMAPLVSPTNVTFLVFSQSDMPTSLPLPVAFTSWSRAGEMGGVESQFATNYLGHYALCKGLLPELVRGGMPATERNGGSPARIILVSSVLHKVEVKAKIKINMLVSTEGEKRTRWYCRPQLVITPQHCTYNGAPLPLRLRTFRKGSASTI